MCLKFNVMKKNMIKIAVVLILLTLIPAGILLAQKNSPNLKEIVEGGELIYQDDFDGDLSNWVIENKLSDESKVEVKDGRLLIDVNSGATIWYKQKLSGNLLIEFHRKVVVDNGPNDRLSDFNFFWMATDPRNDDLFTRDGTFAQYDSLSLYYVGIGGNYNSTTRFRKYMGTGDRLLLQEKNDKQHLLQPNKIYFIQILVCNGTTTVFVDGEEYFTYNDPKPLIEGYFGFRTVKSRQEIEDIRMYRIRK